MPLLYSRANISGPSYYNLCLNFSILSLLLGAAEGKNKNVKYVCSGITASLAVLCNPYLSLIIIPTLSVMLFIPKWRERALYIGLGVLVSAACYCAAFIDLSDLSELVSSLGHVLSDPAHSGVLKQNTISFLIGIAYYVPAIGFPLVFVGCLFVLIMHFSNSDWRNVGVAKILYLLLELALVIETATMARDCECFVISVTFSILSFPYALYALVNRRKSFGLLLYFSGLAMAICWVLASNTSIDAPTVGFCISSVGSVRLVAADVDKTTGISCKVQNSVLLLVCIVLLGVFSAHRFLGIYRDAPVSELTVRIDNGPAAGLYTTAAHAEQYKFIHAKIVEMGEKYPGEGVLFTSLLPWAYLSSDMPCASPTTWEILLSDKRLQPYYESHPLPGLVFIFSEEVGAFGSATFNNHGGSNTINSNEYEGDFYQYILNNGRLVEENSLMKIYRLE